MGIEKVNVWKSIRGEKTEFSKSLFFRGVTKVIFQHPKMRGKGKVKIIIRGKRKEVRIIRWCSKSPPKNNNET